MHRPYASRGFNDGAVARTTRGGFWQIMVDAAGVDVAFHRRTAIFGGGGRISGRFGRIISAQCTPSGNVMPYDPRKSLGIVEKDCLAIQSKRVNCRKANSDKIKQHGTCVADGMIL